MFSSIFGAKKQTPEEVKIINSQPYQHLETEDEKKGYMKAVLNEQQIYKKKNLNPIIQDVKIRLEGIESDLFVHTIKYPKKQNTAAQPQNKNEVQSVLCLHGYGQTSLSYYRMINLFQDQFDAYAIDFLGMGLSSHHMFNHTTLNEIINYFIESIEQWRIAQGISKLIIVGHSFGGYMGFNYALKHQNRVSQLFLVSPLGGTRRTQEEVDAWMKARKEEDGFFKKQLFSYFTNAWHEKNTIARFFKKPLVPTYFLVNGYIKNRLKIEENIRDDWYEYMTGLMELPDSSDKGIFYLLRFPRMSAIYSIEDILKHEISDMQKKLSFHIHFLYGDQDWMCSEGAQRIVESQLVSSSFFKVEGATHNIVYDQPRIIHSYMTRTIQ